MFISKKERKGMNICIECATSINDDSYNKSICNECTNRLRKDWFKNQYIICDDCDNIIYDVENDMSVKDLGDKIIRKRHRFCQQLRNKQDEIEKELLKKWNITQKSIENEVKKQAKEAKARQDAFDDEEKEAMKEADKKFKALKLEADKKIEKELANHRKNKEEMEKYIAQVDSKALKEAKQKAKLAKKDKEPK